MLVLPCGVPASNSVRPSVPMPAEASGERERNSEGKIRVLLVDDHVMVRQGLRGILESYPDLQVVKEAANGQEAVECARAYLPDVVIMDINLPKLDGVEATRLIKRESPDTIVIGLSVHQAGQIEDMLREAGASAYVTKDEASDYLYEAIVKTVRGSLGNPQGVGQDRTGASSQ